MKKLTLLDMIKHFLGNPKTKTIEQQLEILRLQIEPRYLETIK